MVDDLQIKGKYYLQHYDSNYKDYFYGLEHWEGMNSCSSPFSPINELISNGEHIDDLLDIDDCTYVVEVDVKIHKFTKEEYEAWLKLHEPK